MLSYAPTLGDDLDASDDASGTKAVPRRRLEAPARFVSRYDARIVERVRLAA
jgi:hypothetical protein